MQNLFDDAVDLMLGFEKTANEQIARAEAAEAEAARLREVLTALAGDEPPADSDEVLRAGR